VDLERELQYEEMRLVGREELELKVVEARGRKERALLDLEMARDRERRVHDREQKIKDREAELQQQLLAAQNEAKRAEISREIQKGQVEVYKFYKETKLSLELREKRENTLLVIEEEERRMRMRLEEREREQKLKLDMVAALSNASIEAVLASSGPEQAKIIADLKQTETLKGMSEEQILAWAASKDARLVTALEKKYAGVEKQELEFLYRRWMEDKDKTRDQMTKTMQEMFNKALETQRDVSVAATGANRPTVITGAGGMGAVVTGMVPGQGAYRCTKCGAEVPVHHKFCGACGCPVSGTVPPASGNPA